MKQMVGVRGLPRKAVTLALLAAWGMVVGCHKAGGTHGKVRVSGIVRQQSGEPLPGGNITFYDGDGTATKGRAVIREDGTYDIQLIQGTFTAAVDNDVLKSSRMPRQMAEMAKKMQEQGKGSPDLSRGSLGRMPTGTWVAFPARYKNPKTSGLTIDARQGDAVAFDVTLDQ